MSSSPRCRGADTGGAEGGTADTRVVAGPTDAGEVSGIGAGGGGVGGGGGAEACAATGAGGGAGIGAVAAIGGGLRRNTRSLWRNARGLRWKTRGLRWKTRGLRWKTRGKGRGSLADRARRCAWWRAQWRRRRRAPGGRRAIPRKRHHWVALPVLPGQGDKRRNGRAPREPNVEESEVDQLSGLCRRDRPLHERQLLAEQPLRDVAAREVRRRIVGVLTVGERGVAIGLLLPLGHDLEAGVQERRQDRGGRRRRRGLRFRHGRLRRELQLRGRGAAGRPPRRRRRLTRRRRRWRAGSGLRRGAPCARRWGRRFGWHGFGLRWRRRRGQRCFGGRFANRIALPRHGVDRGETVVQELDGEPRHRAVVVALQPRALEGSLPRVRLDAVRLLLGLSERAHLDEPTHGQSLRGHEERDAP